MGQSSKRHKITDYLKATGYPLELLVSAMLSDRGWEVFNNPSYMDSYTGQNKSYDIRAIKQWELFPAREGKWTEFLNVALVIECKKSTKKPWVFFVTPTSETDLNIKRLRIPGNFFCSEHPRADSSHLDFEQVVHLHHYYRLRNKGRTYTEVFVSPDRPSQIFRAISSAVEGTLFESRAWRVGGYPLIYPIIVFSGDLYQAKALASDEIALRRARHVQVVHSYATQFESHFGGGQYSAIEFVVDVVRFDYLSSFLRMIEKEHLEISRRMRARHEAIASG